MTPRPLLACLALLAASCGTGDETATRPSMPATVTPSTPDAMQHFDLAIALHAFEHERQAAAASRRAARSRPPRVLPPGRARGAGASTVRWTGGVFDALARCESGGNPRAVSASGTYRGAFQFEMGTWRSLGMDGDPINHSYEVQLAAAKRLQARSGWGQWPACSKRLGLR